MNMKKVMAAAAAVCMLCTAVAATNPNASAFRTIIASAADEQLKSGDFTYELVNDTVTITACAVNEGVVEIPSEIDGKPVTAIGAAAFYGSKISGVVFPDTLTEIGGGAFWHSPSLTSVKIPDGVTFVGNHAFADCQSLTEIEIPESVTSFGAAPFDLTPWTDARREENPFVIVNGIVIDAAKAVDDILAKRKAEEEALKKDLEDAVSAAENGSGRYENELVLPEEVGDRKITWREKKDRIYLIFPLLGLITAVALAVKGRGLLTVSVCSCAAVFITEMLIKFL